MAQASAVPAMDHRVMPVLLVARGPAATGLGPDTLTARIVPTPRRQFLGAQRRLTVAISAPSSSPPSIWRETAQVPGKAGAQE